MKESFPTDSTIRQYLLGRLDEQEELEKALSERICFNHELAEWVQAIEDEIIEDYLDGTLSAADRKAVEEYFLRPPERREKLSFARLLRERLGKKPGAPAAQSIDIATGEMSPAQSGPPVWAIHWRSHFRTYCELAALVLIIASSLIYINDIRHQLQSEKEASGQNQAQLESELARERDHAANLARELAQYEPPVAMMAPFTSALRAPEAHRVTIRPFTERIRVEIEPPDPASVYDVRVENQAKTTIWSQSGLKPSSGALRFEVPAQGITAGDYEIILTSQPIHTEKSYWFRAKIVK